MKKKKIITASITFIVLLTILIYFIIDNSSSDVIYSNVKDLDSEVKLDMSDERIDWDNYTTNSIELTDSITITTPGVYFLTGTINDGLITVNTTGNVKLVLNNVAVTNNNGPSIYVENAETVVISTVEGTVNTFTDGEEYISYDGIDGCIYSKDDLVLEGSGTLVVNSNYEDGIVSKDDLKINSGTYIINSKDDAIRGKDSVYIKDGTFTINALGDGIKSTNESDTLKGYVKIDNGTFSIDANDDGIDAVTKILIEDGIFDINVSSLDEDSSAKGIKAGGNIIILDGNFTIVASDDAIHSNDSIGIENGNFSIESKDDGVHADNTLIIDNGGINVAKCYEGLEALNIIINDGDIKIVSSDDGINAAEKTDSSNNNQKMPGMESGNARLIINGGNIYVNAKGDGLDANGSIYINGGYVLVDGPTSNGDSALDYDGELVITKGTLIAVGSSGMAQGISASSSQYGVLINFSKTYSSGSVIKILNSNDEEVMSYETTKNFSSIVYSSEKLAKGSYKVQINDEDYTSFEIDDISVVVGRNGFNNRPRR